MDWPDNEHYSVFTASVLKPDYEHPVPVVAMSVVKGRDRVFIKFPTLDALHKLFVVPEIYIERLATGWMQAVEEAAIIQKQLKTLMQLSKLAPGSQVVRTDTGEVIAEVESFLKDRQ
jgi:hypothetical protein